MKLLLDTHVLLWWLLDNTRLRRPARDAIADAANRVYVSVVNVWEIAIKVGLGKLPVPPNVATWLPAQLQQQQLTVLPITVEHALGVEHLPGHHNDPFDRLLIAQAVAEGLTIVTSDPAFARYGVPLIRN